MQSTEINLALLPLSANVFPGGRMQLRIFEPRYIRMVKESLQEARGFAICMLNPKGDTAGNQHIFPIGTAVSIIDFESLADGTLGITVAGSNLVEIKSITAESDGLKTAQAILLTPWSSHITKTDIEKAVLSDRLREVYAAYPDVAELYKETYFDDIGWLCARWLELLPLEPDVKQNLLASHSPRKISNYIYKLFEQL